VCNYKTYPEKGAWVKSIRDRGEMPVLIILEVTEKLLDANDLETKWIAHYKDLGSNLINKSTGGYGTTGIRTSEETREKQRQRKLGRKSSEETKQRTSQSLKGRKLSEETKKNISNSLLGSKRKKNASSKYVGVSWCNRSKNYTSCFTQSKTFYFILIIHLTKSKFHVTI
jgi:hypothetical protein